MAIAAHGDNARSLHVMEQMHQGKPWSLSYLCRIAIRTAIGTERIKDIHYDLAKCLPPPLCSYVANETNNFSSSKA
jgi:hypothetical protein